MGNLSYTKSHCTHGINELNVSIHKMFKWHKRRKWIVSIVRMPDKGSQKPNVAIESIVVLPTLYFHSILQYCTATDTTLPLGGHKCATGLPLRPSPAAECQVYFKKPFKVLTGRGRSGGLQ